MGRERGGKNVSHDEVVGGGGEGGERRRKENCDTYLTTAPSFEVSVGVWVWWID